MTAVRWYRRLRHTRLIAGPQALTALILTGTWLLVLLFTLILLASLFLSHHYYVWPRLVGAGLVMAYLFVPVWLFRRGRYRAVAWLVIAFYALLGTTVLVLWGVNAPNGLLILCFVLILSGTMLGARYIVPTTGGLIVLIASLQLAEGLHLTHPDTASLSVPSSYIDIATYGTLFAIFALVSWISGRRMEQSLEQALHAEEALQAERDLLATRLEQKTAELKAAQIEEMRQLYRFAELGQLATVLLHDLANNLTALTLDIDDLGRQVRRNESVSRAKESIAYLEKAVGAVRRQIHERDEPVIFDVIPVVLATIGTLESRSRRAGVAVMVVPGRPTSLWVNGDPVRLTHVLTILVSNALDAYAGLADGSAKGVTVTTYATRADVRISVTDHGKGISDDDRARLFAPFVSTKPDGMGVGLFIAREIVERHFGGALTLGSGHAETVFTMTLPRARRGR